MSTPDTRTAQLAAFAAGLRFEDIPAGVIARCEDLMADWLGSAFAGRQARLFIYGGTDAQAAQAVISRVSSLASNPRVGTLLA